MFLMQLSRLNESVTRTIANGEVATTNAKKSLEQAQVPFDNAKYDVSRGAGKTRETPETANARKMINEYAAKLPEKARVQFTMNLGVVYCTVGEPSVRSDIVKDPKVLDRILGIRDMMSYIESQKMKLQKTDGFLK